MDQAGEYGEVSGSTRGEFTIKAQGILRGREGMRHETAQHLSQRMEPELKGGRNSKVPTASAQGPKEIWVLLRRHGGYVSGGGHQFDRQQIVGRQPVLSQQPSQSAAEREPGDPGRG